MILGILIAFSGCVPGPKYECENVKTWTKTFNTTKEACRAIRSAGDKVAWGSYILTVSERIFVTDGVQMRRIELVCEDK